MAEQFMKHCNVKKRSPGTRHQRHTARIYGISTKELLIIGCVVACIALLIKTGDAYFFQSELFGLKELRISGCQLTRPEELASCAQIHKGMNLLSINLVKATAQVENSPYVYKAILKRTLPGTLEIYVDERKPRALIKLDDFFLIDERGEIFKKAETAERHYPVLTGLTRDDLYYDGGHCMEIIRSALRLLDCVELEDRFNGSELEIAIDKHNGLTLITIPERLEIAVGFEGFAEKLQSLWKIVDDLDDRGLAPQSIYLKSDQKAYVTLRGDTQTFGSTGTM